MSENKRSFKFNANSVKQQVAEQEKRAEGTDFGPKQMKLDKVKTVVLILPPIDEEATLIMETNTYEIYRGPEGKKEFVMKVASPQFVQLPDAVMKKGFTLRNKFKDSENKKLQEVWKNYMPKTNYYVNAIEVTDGKALKEGPKILKLPKPAYDLVISELKDNDYDFRSFTDLNEGRPLVIEHNGEKGFKKKYTAVKFMAKGQKLLEKGLVDEEKLLAEMADLKSLQPAQSEEGMVKLMAYLDKEADRIIRANGGTLDDEVEGEEVGEELEKASAADDAEFSLDV
jgi:hypothetical protein